MVTTTRHRSKRPGAPATVMAGTVLLTLSHSLIAAPTWKLTPTLSVQESYTDNLELEAENETASFITEVVPGATLSKQGDRIRVEAAYQLQYLDYTSGAGHELNHQLSFSSEAELIEEHFFVDANARYSQLLTNRRNATTGDNLTAPGSRTDAFVFEVEPSWRQRLDTVLGKNTTVGFDLNLNTVSYSNVNDDSEGYGINFFVDTRANASKFYWSLNLDQRRADPDSSPTQESESIAATLGYRVSSKIEAQLRYGYGDNHLDAPVDDDAEAGTFWGGDLLLRPTGRTNLNLTYNSRLLSNNARGIFFAHRQKHVIWTLNYQESISSTRQELLQFVPVASIICPVNPALGGECRIVDGSETVVPTPDQQVITVVAPLPTLTEERFLQNSTTANVVMNVSKSTWNLGVFVHERERLLEQTREEDTGFNASWTWRLSGRTSTQLQYMWSRLETQNLPDDYQRGILISANRSLTPDSNVSLQLQHHERDSGDAARNFEENRITLAYDRAF